MLNRYDTCDIDQLKDIFLGIYANPIVNKGLLNDAGEPYTMKNQVFNP